MHCQHETLCSEHIFPICWIWQMNWGKVQRYYLMGSPFLWIFIFPKISDISRAVIIGIFFLWFNHHFHDSRIMCSTDYNKGCTSVSFCCGFMLLYFSWRSEEHTSELQSPYVI